MSFCVKRITPKFTGALLPLSGRNTTLVCCGIGVPSLAVTVNVHWSPARKLRPTSFLLTFSTVSLSWTLYTFLNSAVLVLL